MLAGDHLAAIQHSLAFARSLSEAARRQAAARRQWQEAQARRLGLAARQCERWQAWRAALCQQPGEGQQQQRGTPRGWRQHTPACWVAQRQAEAAQTALRREQRALALQDAGSKLWAELERAGARRAEQLVQQLAATRALLAAHGLQLACWQELPTRSEPLLQIGWEPPDVASALRARCAGGEPLAPPRRRWLVWARLVLPAWVPADLDARDAELLRTA
ncbi:hypothetical protein HT031_004128 [Scenedesmus sp. PABB004]|nr:hypothetical protein HT031_004128 [Scenedesmus sp. PABB004]